MGSGICIARSLRNRTPPPEEVEGHDGYNGDPHAPVGLYHERGGSGASGGLGDYASRGSDVYNGI